MTNIIPWTARSASMRSFSDCGADLSELLGRMCEKPSLSSMAFSRGRWQSRESWNTPMPFSLGLLTSAVLYCVLKVQSKGIGSCSPRERPGNANWDMLKPLEDWYPYGELFWHCYFGEPHWFKTNKKNPQKNNCSFQRGPMDFKFWNLSKVAGFSVSVFVYGKWTSKLKSSAVFLWFDCSVRNGVLNSWRGMRIGAYSCMLTLGKLYTGQNCNTGTTF